MNEPLLSVVIPVYDTEQYFERCIDSVNSQTYRNIEIIVVNDGSHGDIGKIVPKQNNLKYVEHEKNQGLFKARITGYENSSGDYVCFLDSDDYVSPDFYRSLMAEIFERKLDIVAGDTVFEKADGKKFKRNLHESNFEDAVITGGDVRKAFFSQEMSCFIWHTIWNKIYRRELWEKCIEDFKKVDGHLVMTEDILFSSILFYNAESFLYVPNEGYRYCENLQSSTDNTNSNYDKFAANISDIKCVFDFIDRYMKEHNADIEIIEDIRKSREFYSRIWRRYQIDCFGHGSKSKKSKEVIDSLMPGYDRKADKDDFLFEMLETDYNSMAEEIKNLIIDDKCKVVSFDIFDTLIVRPFYKPLDIFLLMDGKRDGFERFSKIRAGAEYELRLKWHDLHKESDDFSINDIYDYIKKEYKMPEDDVDAYRAMELSYETKYCFARRFAKGLFELAKYLGKRIVLVSDMYLEADFVDQLLKKNGYQGYERMFISSKEGCLKYNGKLFDEMIKYVNEKPENIVHIGDDKDKDYFQSKKKGLIPILLPKITDAFKDKIYAPKKKKLDQDSILPPYAKSDLIEESPAFRTMISLVGMKAFDNPFPSYNDESDFNASVKMIGYYPVGMHVMGICKWIDDAVSRSGVKSVSFLSRDGFLVKKAYEVYIGNEKHVKTNYVSCSRRCLLPWMIDSVSDLYNISINFTSHTPKSICSILEFCLDIPSDVILQDDENFESESDYHDRMHRLFEQYFSKSKLDEAKRMVREYYTSTIEENSFVFDMGYSGCNPAALTRALGYHVNFLYVYKTESLSCYYENKYSMDLQTMYDFSPMTSGVIREHLLSENSGSCIGFMSDNGKIIPKFESRDDSVIRSYVAENIQKYALNFVKDYCDMFRGEDILFRYNPVIVSVPFEYMLVGIKEFDCRLFCCSYSDDAVWSNTKEISIYERWTDIMTEYYGKEVDVDKRIMVTVDSKGIHDIITFDSSVLLRMYKAVKALKKRLKRKKDRK